MGRRGDIRALAVGAMVVAMGAIASAYAPWRRCRWEASVNSCIMVKPYVTEASSRRRGPRRRLHFYKV